MHPFRLLRSRAIPLPNRDVDTDQIIPARYLKVTDKAGLAEGLFYEWRYTQNGELRPEFPLNQPERRGAQILLAGDNFGCGSSREHAPWALLAWGIRAVVSTSFADIFRNNALKNGILPVVIADEMLEKLMQAAQADPSFEITIDLEKQSLALPDGTAVSFPIDSFSKLCLLEGVNQLGYLLRFEDRIAAYERAHGIR